MFADLELARRLEATEGAAGLAFVNARPGQKACARSHGACLMFDGLKSPLTQTFGLGMEEPATEEVLAEVEDFFAQEGSPVNHEICPLAGIGLPALLVKRGYVPVELSNVLFMDLAAGRQEPMLNPDLSVKAAGSADLETYAEVMARGWSEATEFADQIEEMSLMMTRAVGYSGFLVYKKEEPIAAAGLFIHEGVALLAGASTVPEHRGHGAQRAVLTERLRYAAGVGCTLAMMVTEPGGASQRNGERNGFRIAYTRTKWRLDAAAA